MGFEGLFQNNKPPDQEPVVAQPAPVATPVEPSTVGTVEPETGVVQQKKKAVPKSRTIYHQTLGQTDTANTAVKSLLGQ